MIYTQVGEPMGDMTAAQRRVRPIRLCGQDNLSLGKDDLNVVELTRVNLQEFGGKVWMVFLCVG